MPKPFAPVLVVEDDRELQDSLADVLGEAGFEVVAAEDGLRALRYLQSHPAPCVVLLDLMMPGMDGFELRRRMLADPNLACIPVVVTTALSHDFRSRDRLRARAYLHKPFDMAALLDVVRQCGEDP